MKALSVLKALPKVSGIGVRLLFEEQMWGEHVVICPGTHSECLSPTLARFSCKKEVNMEEKDVPLSDAAYSLRHMNITKALPSLSRLSASISVLSRFDAPSSLSSATGSVADTPASNMIENDHDPSYPSVASEKSELDPAK